MMPTVQHLRKTRVLLADDHETILAQVRSVLSTEFDIVGSVGNGRDAVAEAQRLDPDVLVTDISMPVLDGLQAASKLQSIGSRIKIIFLSVHEDPEFVSAALAVGASGYVTKATITSELIPAIHAAIEGQIYISSSIPLE